jgi:phosphoribosylglycinamide formyltransferase 1
MASGSGSNFQAIIDAIEQGTLPAKITGLIAGKPGIGAIERARNHQIPVSILSNHNDTSYEQELHRLLEQYSPDLIVLAGFLKKIPDSVVHKYPGQIVNIHPSLLPKYGGKGFYGLHVHRAVIEAGDTVSGCTVHFVNEYYDQGDIIRQAEVPVLDDDTPESLAKRVLKQEHQLYPEVISTILNSKTDV